MHLGLQDKNILITGSSKGIGKAIAISFLEEGAKVILLSRGKRKLEKTTKDLQKKYGVSKVLSFNCDCSNITELHSLRKKIQAKWGHLDVVVANIGNGRSVPDPIPSQHRWDITWKSNFETAINTTRAFLHMIERSKGCLLFISSIAGLEVLGAPVDYSTAKAALISFAKNLASKMGDKIRVNVLAPGNVIFSGGEWEKKLKKNPSKIHNLIETNVPMGRFGKPEEIADAAVFLCSSRASFITAATLVVDGGQTRGL